VPGAGHSAGDAAAPVWPFTDGASFILDIPPHTRAVWGDDTSLAEGGMYPRKIPQSSNTHRRIAMPVTATATASPPVAFAAAASASASAFAVYGMVAAVKRATT